MNPFRSASDVVNVDFPVPGECLRHLGYLRGQCCSRDAKPHPLNPSGTSANPYLLDLKVDISTVTTDSEPQKRSSLLLSPFSLLPQSLFFSSNIHLPALLPLRYVLGTFSWPLAVAPILISWIPAPPFSLGGKIQSTTLSPSLFYNDLKTSRTDFSACLNSRPAAFALSAI